MLKKCFIVAVTAGGSACAYVQYQWSRFEANEGLAEYTRSHTSSTVSHRAELGSHPPTYYSSVGKLREQPLNAAPLTQHRSRVDVVVVGGGLAGLHTALALAERGKSVVVLERRQVGCGASGRNGGDAIVGFHTPPDELAEIVGAAKASLLYQQSVAGYERLKDLIQKHSIKCGMEEVGAITMNFEKNIQFTKRNVNELIAEEERFCEEQQNKFKEELEVWDVDRVRREGLRSDRYSYGVFNKRNMSLNPLELVLGLARVCKKQGVEIYEGSPVTGVKKLHHEHATSSKDSKKAPPPPARYLVTTASGSVEATDVVLATASAPAAIAPELAIATAPLVTAMMLTKPIEKHLLDEVLSNKFAVFDVRFALAYYRRVEGNRILFGTLASGLPMNREWAESRLVGDLTTTFPSLKGHVVPDLSWQGRLDAKLPVFPLLGRNGNGLWYSLGYSGHGLVPTCAGGELLASAIVSADTATPDTRYQLWNDVSMLQKHPLLPVHMPIGGPLGQLGAIAFCYWTSTRDWLEKKF